jgi:hypothetical protein
VVAHSHRGSLGLDEDAARAALVEGLAEIAWSAADVEDEAVEQRGEARQLNGRVFSQGAVEPVGVLLLDPEDLEQLPRSAQSCRRGADGGVSGVALACGDPCGDGTGGERRAGLGCMQSWVETVVDVS